MCLAFIKLLKVLDVILALKFISLARIVKNFTHNTKVSRIGRPEEMKI
jgi:hypothetical protein